MRTLKDVASAFRELGWETRWSLGTDLLCSLFIGKTHLEIIPNIAMKEGRIFALRATPSLSTAEFTHTSNAIFDGRVRYPKWRPSKHEPLIVGQWLEVKCDTIDRFIVETLAEESKKWASGECVFDAIAKRAGELGETGQSQLFHLTALALSGEVDALKAYRAGENGVRAEFVPMIDRGTLDRAIGIAETRRQAIDHQSSAT